MDKWCESIQSLLWLFIQILYDTTANTNIRRGRVKSFYQHLEKMLASMKLTPSRFGRMYQSIKLSPRWRKSDSPLFKRDSCICVQGSTDCCCIFAAPLGMISRSVKPVFGKASANVTPLCLSQNAWRVYRSLWYKSCSPPPESTFLPVLLLVYHRDRIWYRWWSYDIT